MTLYRASATLNNATKLRTYETHIGDNYIFVYHPSDTGGGNKSKEGGHAGPRLSMLKIAACGTLVIVGGAALIVVGPPAVTAAGGAAAVKAGIGATYAILKGLAAKSAVAAALA